MFKNAVRCRRWIAACADAPISRSGWCLVCHFAAVAADEFNACAQYGWAAQIYHVRKPCFLLHLYAIIQLAFVRASRKFKHASPLGPDYSRVTTALRGVVTRPLAHSNHCARRWSVTQVMEFQINRRLFLGRPLSDRHQTSHKRVVLINRGEFGGSRLYGHHSLLCHSCLCDA